MKPNLTNFTEKKNSVWANIRQTWYGAWPLMMIASVLMIPYAAGIY